MPWSAVPTAHKRIKGFWTCSSETHKLPLGAYPHVQKVFQCWVATHHKLRRSECASCFDADAEGPRLTQKELVSDKNTCFFVEMKRLDSVKNERTIWNKESLSLGFVAASTQAFLFQTFTQLSVLQTQAKLQ